MVQVALDAGISVETLRKIETGRIATPAFFTISAVAEVLGISLDTIARTLETPQSEQEVCILSSSLRMCGPALA